MEIIFRQIPKFIWTNHAYEKLMERDIYMNYIECEEDIIKCKNRCVLDKMTNNITIHWNKARIVMDIQMKTIITIMNRIKDTPKSVRHNHRKHHRFEIIK